MFVKERFHLDEYTKDFLQSLIPPFGYNGFGELVFYRTYSRIRKDGGQENWADCVIRVVEGTFSIRKDWYTKNYIHWDEEFWQSYAGRFAKAMYLMQWLPPGRGLWAMGSDFVYDRGSMALQNCALCVYGDDFGSDLNWMMDALMMGVGVGFKPIRNDGMELYIPHGLQEYIIPDSREGWCDSSQAIVDSYLKPGRQRIKPIYDLVRGPGLPIKGFGGISSGPQPLIDFHNEIISFLERYKERKEYDSVRLKADCGNACGKCVVAGNLRRSAEIMIGSIKDPIYMDLKDYDRFPERASWGWLSNNSVELIDDQDFELLGEIAKRVIKNGEPGYINRQNMKYARIGKKMKGLRKDDGIGVNPCITGETKVLTADGRGYVPMIDLVNAESDIDVFCINNRDEMCIRKMRNPRLTNEQANIYRVTFDSGVYVDVTGNHKFMLRNRSFKEAQYLGTGDQLAKVNRYIPDGRSHSGADRYVSYWYGKESSYEHILIAAYNFGEIDSDEHVDHKDGDCKNNNAINLNIRPAYDHLQFHSIGEQNINWSGWTHDELLAFGVKLAKKLGRRFSTSEWKKYGPVKAFSQWRNTRFESVMEFAWLCADIAEVLNIPLDTRTLRIYNKAKEQGYEVDIIDETTYVIKVCESCKNEFWIPYARREQGYCSFTCCNHGRDYSKNVEGQRKTFAEKRETLREKQLDVYTALELVLKRAPMKKEWKEACHEQNVSSEMGRVGSPFQHWYDVKYQARKHNYRVLFVQIIGKQDVYNGTVDEFHNFIIGGFRETTLGERIVERGIINANCGEQILCNKECCTLSETLPTVCKDFDEWLQACEYATLYASTVTLLPTHQPATNRIMSRNRRIGVGIIDFTGWIHEEGVHKVTKYLRDGYDHVRSINKWANEEAGIPIAIRVTTMKPGGSVPKLPGRTSGLQYPNFHYMIRRVRIAKNSKIHPLLVQANIPYEEDVRDRYTDVFEFPIIQGPAKTSENVTIWQQAMNLILVQREWSDNAVSNSICFKPKWPLVHHIEHNIPEELAQYIGLVASWNLTIGTDTEYIVPERYKVVFVRDSEGDLIAADVHEFDPRHEENDIEAVLSAIAPLTKSVALLPHSPKGAYPQMPEEGISVAEYERRLASISKIDWSQLQGSDGQDEKYCTADSCER